MNGTTRRNPELTEFERYFAVSITASLIPVILAGNILVMISYKINYRLRTRTNTFLISLAVSDIIVGGINLPMWVFCMVEYGSCGSRNYSMIFKFLDRFGAFASIFHLTAISIERYIAVVRPYLFYRLPERFFFGASAFAWVIAIVLSCLSWLQSFPTKYYNMAVFLVGFLLPAAIVISMYVGIFRSAMSLLKRTPSFDGVTDNKNRLIRADQKVAVTVAVISGLFIIAWFPFFLFSIIASYCASGCLPDDGADILRLVTTVKWLHYSNSGVNPIIYAFRDEEWKKTFRRILFGRIVDGSGNSHTSKRMSTSRLSTKEPKNYDVIYL